MPKIIKIINESIELEDEPIKEMMGETIEEPKPVKEKKTRKPKIVKEVLAVSEVKPIKEKKTRKPKILKVEEIKKIELVNLKEVEEIKRGKGRPKLTEEQKEFKIKMKEDKLKEQMTKLSNKISVEAKQEAKKKVISKIKQQLKEQDEDLESISSSDDEELQKIMKNKKKPIVIINKLDKPTKRKEMLPPPSNVVFC